MIDLREVRSVTEFQRNIKGYVGRLKKNGTPLVLTVNGRAELVVQDAVSYCRAGVRLPMNRRIFKPRCAFSSTASGTAALR